MSVNLVPLTTQAAAMVDEAANPLDLLRRLLAPGGSVPALLRAVGADPAALLDRVPAGTEPESCRHVRHGASREAALLGHRRADLVHLLMALLYTDSPATARLLAAAGVTLFDLRTHLQSAANREAARLRREPRPSLRAAIRISPVALVAPAIMAGAGALLWVGVPDQLVGVVTLLFVLAGWIASLCLHEFGHAAVAYLGGDESVARSGYLTLNPLKYAHPVLSIVLPAVFVLIGGIGLPGGAVFVNRSALRSRGWDTLVSAAGPAATLLFALALAVPFLLGMVDIGHLAFWSALAFLAVIEIGAVLLNLLPIPPLDGFGMLAPLLSPEARALAARFGVYGIFVVFLLLWQGPVADAFWGLVWAIAGHLHIPALLAEIGLAQMPFGR
jgi:Zn-dependent protease